MCSIWWLKQKGSIILFIPSVVRSPFVLGIHTAKGKIIVKLFSRVTKTKEVLSSIIMRSIYIFTIIYWSHMKVTWDPLPLIAAEPFLKLLFDLGC